LPEARLDVAELLSTVLGVHMPRRADFMAGGSQASNSYVYSVNRAATQVLEECEAYVALKHWLQRAELPMSLEQALPVPSAQRLVEAAELATQEADAAGDIWLQQRGPVWYEGVLSSPHAEQGKGARARAQELYTVAFQKCAAALKAHPELLTTPWFKDFWSRNYDALMIQSVVRNVQEDVDTTRQWVSAQLRFAPKGKTYRGVHEPYDALWAPFPPSEACLVDCLLEVLYFFEADREKYRNDPLMQLVIDEPPGHVNFSIVSAMGVITDGAAGTEMAATYARLEKLRGVVSIRADTATLQSVDYNAAKIEEAVRDNISTPWGWVGYSQGCANAFRAEALMLQGTPQQQQLMSSFRCRQLICSAANGSALATSSDLKIVRALIDGERFIKRFQTTMSSETQQLVLGVLQSGLSSRVAFAVFGSVQSLTHEGARRMWRDDQHCYRAPTTSIRGVVEKHTQPESLLLLSNWLGHDGMENHDTQVVLGDAVGHPKVVKNPNAELLARTDMQSAVQRTHHWSPLKEEVLFITTEDDSNLAMFDTPKDRHIFPWIDINTRFGIIERLPPVENHARNSGRL